MTFFCNMRRSEVVLRVRAGRRTTDAAYQCDERAVRDPSAGLLTHFPLPTCDDQGISRTRNVRLKAL